MTKLSDTQLMLLSGAAQRADRLIALPDRLSASAAKTVVAKLLAAALVEEVPAMRKAPVWRTQDDQPLALRITAAGLATIGIDEAEAAGQEPASSPPPRHARKKDRKVAPASPSGAKPADSGSAADTKQARILDLLRRGTGVTLADLMAATGWQGHSVRGFLSAVVKKKLGLPIVSEKGADGERRYHIAALAASGTDRR